MPRRDPMPRRTSRPRMRPRCSRCGKACFRSEVDARLALATRKTDRDLVRVYPCGKAGQETVWWHLTSKPKRAR